MYAGHKTAGPLFGTGRRGCARGNGRRAFLRRRGTTAVLAMLYLVLFSTLSVGFYASVNTSVQIAGNEQRGVRARLAAESGMEFMKLQLATLGIPAGTQGSELVNQAYARLQYKLDGYPNLGGADVELSSDGNFIYIPGGSDNWITADAQGGRFRAVLEKQNGGQQIQVKVIGRYGTTDNNARALQLKYAVAQNASAIFNYGVASKSAIAMNAKLKKRKALVNIHHRYGNIFLSVFSGSKTGILM
jgi:hypothetical protein